MSQRRWELTQGKLLLGEELVLAELLDFASKHLLGGGCNIVSKMNLVRETSENVPVLSMQLALMEMRRPPPCFRNSLALIPTILAWSGWATSAKMTSTIGRSMRYAMGLRASSMMGMTLVRRVCDTGQ